MLFLERCISILYLSPVIFVLWFLHLPVDFSATSWIIFTYLWFLCFSSCNWGVPVWHTGALDECMSSVWGIRWAVARPRSAQGWCLLPKWLESTSLSSRHAATLKPVAQVEASGQGNGPFSREDWGCVFQPTVVQGLRLESLPRIIYLIVTVPRGPRKQASVVTRAGWSGVSSPFVHPLWVVWSPGFSKAAGVLRAGHVGWPLESRQAWSLSRAGRECWGVGVCGNHDSAARWGWRRVLGAEQACSFVEAVSPSLSAQARYKKNAETQPCLHPQERPDVSLPPADALKWANKPLSHVVQAPL